jgi:pimeloyl-ACP methyl ester carboxylesterase
MKDTESALAALNRALIHYEIAGTGDPFVMIHAGVADSRQWDKEFAYFQRSFRVLRYDLRGYGRSDPVEGDFTHIADLAALLDHLRMSEPLILMGCSMGGRLAMDFALENPSRARAILMVDAGPSGLQLDVPKHPKADAAEKAYNDGDLDLVAELETQIWFDGMGRTSSQVDPSMRKLVFDMNRRGLEQDAKRLGTRLPDASMPAAGRLADLRIPVLVVIGANDIPYNLAAADHMVDRIPGALKVTMPDAAHLPNLDHPDEFRRIVSAFLDALPALGG